ncbi:MAG: C40 family peptidase [Ignavibacteria bacterium]|nr:C40 family peptidase [Ignavibacteria bacterium]
MKFTDKLIISFVLTFSVLIALGCSSSSGSLRYGDNNQDEVTQKEKSPRYEIVDTSNSDDSSYVLDDEDIPEFQDPSDFPEDESKIDLTNLLKKLNDKSSGSDVEFSSASKKDLMIMEIIRYMDTPYKYGGNSLNGIDCSAFTQSVYKNSWLLDLNRSARDQFQQGMVIENRSDLKFGDLVFFNTRRRVKPGHVGIYIGENLFAHASSKLGVTISSLEHEYYNKRYMGARRFEEE